MLQKKVVMSTDYAMVLQAVHELPFEVGKTVLTNFLQGKNHKTIDRHNLQKFPSFGALVYTDEEINELLKFLIRKKCVLQKSLPQNKYWKVISLTERGKKELQKPTLHTKNRIVTEITEQDKQLFTAFSFFLKDFNDEQKKAIVSPEKSILCIAGAGSGKTTVLTKRIEFLIRFRSVNASDILAITFTRKAKKEMMERLHKQNIIGVRVETFNSFCENELRQRAKEMYRSSVRMASYNERVRLVISVLAKHGWSTEQAVDQYFSPFQKRSKTTEELFHSFVNDCFFIRDYFKTSKKKATEEFKKIDSKHEKTVQVMKTVCTEIQELMQKKGLRNFTDQIVDVLTAWRKKANLIPRFKHVLVDEYQDINDLQEEFLQLLNPEALFCVGDPRQSIFGWRGANINHITTFENRHPNTTHIALTKNYRSTAQLVRLMNDNISWMYLPDLTAVTTEDGKASLVACPSEREEAEFICEKLNRQKGKKIFVLARTNKQLMNLSRVFKEKSIPHIIRSNELRRFKLAKNDEITLATIHSIKGMEADVVFVAGCSSHHFPCRGNEHPVIEMLRLQEYDKDDEERRLLYVAISRAKEELFLTYTGLATSFLSPSSKKLLQHVPISAAKKLSSVQQLAQLKEWRRQKANELGVAPFMVLHDRTLEELVDKKPSTVQELEAIYGFGPKKLFKFGGPIMSILQN